MKDNNPIDCRTPRFSLSSLYKRDKAGGIQGWFTGRPVAYSVNARAAIHSACKILNLGPSDEILAPAYNCGAEIDPLVKSGASVTLYAVDRSTNIDLEDLEKRITPRTKAVYVIHYFGFCQPKIKALQKLCRERGIYLIEDCALALFSETKEGKAGSFGDLSIFCFYKYFPVTGGGALIINNQHLDIFDPFHRPPPSLFAAKLILRPMLRRLLGRYRLEHLTMVLKRVLGNTPRPPMTETQTPSDGMADIPFHSYFDRSLQEAKISRFAKWPLRSYSVEDTVRKRRENFSQYLREFETSPSIYPLFQDLPDGVCPLSFPIIVDDRDALRDALEALPMDPTTWWVGYHREVECTSFHQTHFLKDNLLTLPVNQFLDERQIAFIANSVKQFLVENTPLPSR